jgi:AraC-like DNA-binding protein
MLLERLLENLAVQVDAFATCHVASGWRLRLPGLDWVTFHYGVQGTGQVRGGSGEVLSLTPGSLALVPPHLVHGIQCGPGPYGEDGPRNGAPLRGERLPAHRAGPRELAELVVVCGRLRALYGQDMGLFDHLRDVLVIDFGDEPDVRALFRRMLEEIQSSRPGFRAMATALMNESLIHVFRRLCTAADCSLPWLLGLEDPDLRRALDAMLEHPERPHTVGTLADLCYMSRATFARRFREAFGRPPMEYLRGIRLRKAAVLLRRDPSAPVGSVASRVGFRSRSQFSRAFKEYFDRSPSDFAV